jgi:hypothetical protein
MAGLLACCGVAAEAALLVDFTKEGHGWKGNPRTRDARQEGGFSVELKGEQDPWLEGPAVAVPGAAEAQKLALTLDARVATGRGFPALLCGSGRGFFRGPRGEPGPADAGSHTYSGIIPAGADKLRFAWILRDARGAWCCARCAGGLWCRWPRRRSTSPRA